MSATTDAILDWLTRNPSQQTAAAADALDALSAASVEVRDDTSYTWSGVNERLAEMGVPLEIVMVWDTALKDIPGGSMLGEMLRSGGCDFTRPNLRGALQYALPQSSEPTATVLTALLAIGIRNVTPWSQVAGDAALPTVDEIAFAQRRITSSRWVSRLLNEVINPLVAQGKTIAEIKTAVAAWEG